MASSISFSQSYIFNTFTLSALHFLLVAELLFAVSWISNLTIVLFLHFFHHINSHSSGQHKLKLHVSSFCIILLRFAELRFAELRFAELRFAERRSAERRFAELRFAERRSAELRFAERRSAELRSAELRFAERRSAELRFA